MQVVEFDVSCFVTGVIFVCCGVLVGWDLLLLVSLVNIYFVFLPCLWLLVCWICGRCGRLV